MISGTRITLLNLIIEYSHSLERIAGEKDQIKLLEARAVTDCGLTAKDFRLVATAYHKDQVATLADELQGQLELIETVRSDQGAVGEATP